ncbi:unnamed protein product [Caenorhabditis angaria]|uniref:Transmembrane protein n=1 Tax=Caenorhabditis angaria TaxID=860376 RepID=A0A9P1IP46_9PELO|nr:unnamed protein product [Caenorhabditis angaria]
MSNQNQVPTIKIPRIGVQSNRFLNGQNYTGTHFASSTIPRNAPIDIYNSPTYVVDHLQTRRLSEIDKPYYMPTLLSTSETERFSTAPIRLRQQFQETEFSHASPQNLDQNIRISRFPATSQAIGLNTDKIVHITPLEIAPVEPEKNPAAESMQDVNLLALYNNSSLAYQRVCYLLSRYPAVALCLIATWMLWGRGLGLNTVQQNENIAYIVSLAAGIFILSSQILLSFSHHGSYSTAKVLANFYHFSNLIGLLLSAAIIVFSAISFQNVKNVDTTLQYCKQLDPTYMNNNIGSCISPSDRLIFLSILIGSSASIILLYVFSGIYGCIGQVQMKEKRQIEYKRYSAAQDNLAFKY